MVAMNQPAHSQAKLIATAERELSAFFSAVAGSFGPESATLATKDWLQPSSGTKPCSTRDFISEYATPMSLLMAAAFVAVPGLSFTWRMNLPLSGTRE